MGRFCCVFGCASCSDRDNCLSFFKIPTVIKQQGVLTEEISQKRHDRWIANIRRDAVKIRCATLADCRLADLQTCRLQTCRLQTCRLADLQTADLQTCRLADLQTCRPADFCDVDKPCDTGNKTLPCGECN